MVYDKKKSGDPDCDDKVPAEQHVARMVRAGDGQEVFITESNGPVFRDGSHANLDDPKDDEGDNRPAPGGVATEASDVQTYDAGDTPAGQATEPAADPKDAPASRRPRSGK